MSTTQGQTTGRVVYTRSRGEIGEERGESEWGIVGKKGGEWEVVGKKGERVGDSGEERERVGDSGG